MPLSQIQKPSFELIGTLITTSGASQTLNSLDLTPYKFLLVEVVGISSSGTGTNIAVRIKVNAVGYELFQCNGSIFNTDMALIDLASGAACPFNGGNNAGSIPDCGVRNSDTSLVFYLTAGTYDAGSIMVYGVR